MATWVTRWPSSQSRSANSSAAVVPNVRTSCRRWPFAPGARRHAATLLLVHVQPTSTIDDAFHGGLLRQGAEAERSHPDREFARRARGNSAGGRTLPRHVMAGLLGTTPVRRCSASACTNDSLLSSSEGGSPPMTVMANDRYAVVCSPASRPRRPTSRRHGRVKPLVPTQRHQHRWFTDAIRALDGGPPSAILAPADSPIGACAGRAETGEHVQFLRAEERGPHLKFLRAERRLLSLGGTPKTDDTRRQCPVPEDPSHTTPRSFAGRAPHLPI
jgi:hypothetical protein